MFQGLLLKSKERCK